MATKPFDLHQPKHQHLEHPEQYSAHTDPVRLPAIPDLRFEYSYLRSIQRYVTIRRRQALDHVEHEEQVDKDNGFEHVGREKEHELQTSTLSSLRSSEVIDIQWGQVTWITARDQVISPLLQGALWALASYFLTPFSAQLGARVGNFAHSRLSPSKEGSGVGWLRGWVSGLGLGSSAISPAIRRS